MTVSHAAMSVQARSSRWDFLRPWPWHYYARVSGVFFVLGGAIELVMIKGGFCASRRSEPERKDPNAQRR